MLRSLFENLFRRPVTPAPITDNGELAALRPGSVYSFRTAPYSEFAPLETGRFAAFKVLGLNDKHVAVGVLDGIWSSPPTLTEARRASTLRERRFAHTGREAVFGVSAEIWSPSKLMEVKLVGFISVSPEEERLAQVIANFGVGSRYAGLRFANYAAEGEWRWTHDNAAFVVEYEKIEARNAAERAAKEQRYRTRLSKLTWEALLAETPFERWSPSPPFPPIEFAHAARKRIHDACRELSALGPKPRKADVRAVLKRCVEWFNDADDAAGGVIETEEREDICAVLEEMAYVARQKSLVDEVDNWRTW